jgi:uncharacterized protein with beta-barrel porin domain
VPGPVRCDRVLIGACFGVQLAPGAQVFVDYDVRFGSRLQEHSVSDGLCIHFRLEAGARDPLPP